MSTSLFPDTSRMALKKATSFEAAFDIPCLAETLAAEVGVRIRLQLAGDGLDGVDADLLLLSGRKAVILLDGAIECSLVLFAKFRRDFRHRQLGRASGGKRVCPN